MTSHYLCSSVVGTLSILAFPGLITTAIATELPSLPPASVFVPVKPISTGFIGLKGAEQSLLAQNTPSQTLPEAIAPDTGTTIPGQYSNEYFGFSMVFPEEWAIAPPETKDAVMELGSTLASNSDPALGSVVEASLQNTYQLLFLSQWPLGSPVADNPSFIMLAERVSQWPGITSGEDYLVNQELLLSQISLPYEKVGDIRPVTIGGREFYRSDFQINIMGTMLKQSYVVALDQGYALAFILSASPESLQQLETIMNSIQFQ